MQTAHEIVAGFIQSNAVDMPSFNEWFQDGGHTQDEANIHDARYLNLLENFVEERDAEKNKTVSSSTQATTRPRILNKHTHGIPAGAIYIGRGSPWGNPFVIGRDGNRSEVVAKHAAWIDTQPQLLARLPELRGRDLVCFCFPRSCHGETLRRLAHAPVCETV